ncbi:G-protein coupled receptor 87 [Patagioenas fasciata monilis]|uniref:G-protein coupled receptor 87 n=1 Tax=Patagioenas fasciata monilis TaxID=372326 RepID=A0A1V4KLW0_PATFA|nr:G-protein coupled receptor 87 [Patagioenas fasciata monilis]
MGYNLSYGKLPDDRLSPDNSSAPNATAGSLGSAAHNEFTTIVLPVLYLIIFLASILLNGLAVWIFFHIRNKTSFIFYLKNIVVADLLMTLTFPFKIIQDSQLGPWHFNSFLCRYTTVLFYANMYTTIVFLGLISIDRYLKVVKPFGDSRMYSITFTKVLSACVWVVMAFLALPNLILTNGYPTRRNIDDCLKLKSPLGLQWHTAVIYINTCTFVVVLVVLIGCYIAISRSEPQLSTWALPSVRTTVTLCPRAFNRAKSATQNTNRSRERAATTVNEHGKAGQTDAQDAPALRHRARRMRLLKFSFRKCQGLLGKMKK